jgi:hypothetical protein
MFSKLFLRIQRQILRFFYPYGIIARKKIWGHISTFYKLWSQKGTEWLEKKTINGFCKCVLELNYASIKDSRIFTLYHANKQFCFEVFSYCGESDDQKVF